MCKRRKTGNNPLTNLSGQRSTKGFDLLYYLSKNRQRTAVDYLKLLTITIFLLKWTSFQELEWQSARIEAKAHGAAAANLPPLRLLLGNTHCRIVIKKRLSGTYLI